MKKYLLLLLAGGIITSSCKKDHSKGNPSEDSEKPSTKQYAVNFTVGGGTSLGMAAVSGKLAVNDAATDTLKKYVRAIHYLVYDNTGKAVHQINQTSTTTTNYGIISDSLSPGTYTIIFIGNSIINAGKDINQDYFYVAQPLQADLFYQKLTLTVTNTAISQPVALNRLSSQIQIVATDVIPANIDSLKIEFSPDFYIFSVKEGLGSGYNGFYQTVIKHKFTAAEKGKPNFKVSTLYFNTKPYTTPGDLGIQRLPGTVTITRYPLSAFSTPIVIRDVICEANKTTVLTGRVFEDISKINGFQISFDPAWNPIPETF